MQELEIEDVQPGMKAACRIRNAGGDIVINSGDIITKEMIDRCHSLGVYVVHVLGRPVPKAPKSYDAATCLERVPHLFRNHQENIFMKTMEAFLTRHFSERV